MYMDENNIFRIMYLAVLYGVHFAVIVKLKPRSSPGKGSVRIGQ